MSHSMAHSCNLKEKKCEVTSISQTTAVQCHTYQPFTDTGSTTQNVEGRCHTLISDDAKLTLTKLWKYNYWWISYNHLKDDFQTVCTAHPKNHNVCESHST